MRVLSETPTTKRKRHQDAVETSEQDLSPPGVDTGLLTSVTTTVVMSIIDDMQLSPQSKRQCTVLMSTAAASVGAAMWQLGANWARKPQNVFAGRRAPKSVKTTKKTLSGRRVHFATRDLSMSHATTSSSPTNYSSSTKCERKEMAGFARRAEVRSVRAGARPLGCPPG